MYQSRPNWRLSHNTTKWVSPKGLKDSGIDGYKVGDILNTVRTDLGDKWALCNGEIFNKSSAPLLFDLTSGDSNIFLQKGGLRRGIFYVNGYWVTFLAYESWTDVSQIKIVLYISDNPLGPWTSIEVPGSTTLKPADIAYHNGIYMIVATNVTGTTFIFTATNIAGPWTKTAQGPTAYACGRIAYGNGEWSIPLNYSYAGSDYNSASEYISTDPLSGSWTNHSLKTGGYKHSCGISASAYGDGKFVLAVYESGNSEGFLQCDIYVRNVDETTYTHQLISDVTQKWTMSDLAYQNGLWVGVRGSTVFTASDPSSTWTKLTKGSGLSRIAYENRIWYFPGANSTLYSTPNVNADWSSTVFVGQTLGLGAIAMHDGQIMMEAGESYFAVNNYKHLPTISIDGGHSYIRKK